MNSTAIDLTVGMDFRNKSYRMEVFQRWYTHQLRYASHPGGVYYVLPYLAEKLNWDGEQCAWAAWINGNTQNPVMTLLLMQEGDRIEKSESVLAFYQQHYPNMNWDTDRRHQKARFEEATIQYRTLVTKGQQKFWEGLAPQGWAKCWEAALALPHMGRLSAWSYLEYVRELKVAAVPDADTLLLHDRDGSRSHRNGLCLVTGHDEWIWWRQNPDFNGEYSQDVIEELEDLGEDLLKEAKLRNPDNPAVGYLTLESALCTYKSWHIPNRRYVGVYNDMLYNRLKKAEQAFGHRFDLIWEARKKHLPVWMRLEHNPLDPGCVPVKQNWYLNTGQVIGMSHDWPCFENDFEKNVKKGAYYGMRKHWDRR